MPEGKYEVTTREKPGYQPVSKGPLHVYGSPSVMKRRERSLQMIAERQAEKKAATTRPLSKGGR
jgi:hypothetical protein